MEKLIRSKEKRATLTDFLGIDYNDQIPPARSVSIGHIVNESDVLTLAELHLSLTQHLTEPIVIRMFGSSSLVSAFCSAEFYRNQLMPARAGSMYC